VQEISKNGDFQPNDVGYQTQVTTELLLAFIDTKVCLFAILRVKVSHVSIPLLYDTQS